MENPPWQIMFYRKQPWIFTTHRRIFRYHRCHRYLAHLDGPWTQLVAQQLGSILSPYWVYLGSSHHSLCSFQSTRSMVSIHFDPTFLGVGKNPGLCLTKSYQPLILAKRYGNPWEMDVSHRENNLRSGWVFHICVSMTSLFRGQDML